MMTVFDVVVVAVGVGFGFTVHWAGLLVLTVLLWLLATLMAAFSTATALVTKDISSFAAIINGHQPPPAAAWPGSCCPSPSVPLWLRVLAHFNPLYYLVVASRFAGRRPARRRCGLAGVRGAGSALPPRAGVGDTGVPPGGLLIGVPVGSCSGVRTSDRQPRRRSAGKPGRHRRDS